MKKLGIFLAAVFAGLFAAQNAGAYRAIAVADLTYNSAVNQCDGARVLNSVADSAATQSVADTNAISRCNSLKNAFF